MAHPQVKTPEELAIMQEAGVRLRRVMRALVPQVIAGKTTAQVDLLAQELILQEGGAPGFKRVKGYSWATCLPINNQAVHTPPGPRVIKDGDLLTIDIGLYLEGFHTDHAVSLVVGGEADPKIKAFLEAGKRALKAGIRAAHAGNYIGDISEALEDAIYGAGYKVLKSLTGHGIGRALHEAPIVPAFVDRPRDRTPRLERGLTLAIEVIYSTSCEEIAYEDAQKWSIVTGDGSLAACFEHTIAISDKNPVILT